jgi:hypothetical protein
MKVTEVPNGYVFQFTPPEGSGVIESGVKFLKIKGQLNALNLTSYLPCKIHDATEVGIIGKFALDRQIEPTRALEADIAAAEKRFQEAKAVIKPTALPSREEYRQAKAANAARKGRIKKSEKV